jgi:hypothetical protein
VSTTVDLGVPVLGPLVGPVTHSATATMALEPP